MATAQANGERVLRKERKVYGGSDFQWKTAWMKVEALCFWTKGEIWEGRLVKVPLSRSF